MRTIQQAQANLGASVATIPQRYKDGVAQADWQSKAGSDNAEQLWAQNTAAAAAQKRRQKGVMRVGNEVWRKQAQDLGAPIIGSRITASLAKYGQNFGPVLTAMNDAASRLAPKTNDIATNVLNRVTPVALAARKASPKGA